MESKPELLVTLVDSRVLQVMPFLHVFQQVLHIRVLLLTEAAVLLHLQMDSLYMDLHGEKHRISCTMNTHDISQYNPNTESNAQKYT